MPCRSGEVRGKSGMSIVVTPTLCNRHHLETIRAKKLWQHTESLCSMAEKHDLVIAPPEESLCDAALVIVQLNARHAKVSRLRLPWPSPGTQALSLAWGSARPSPRHAPLRVPSRQQGHRAPPRGAPTGNAH